MPKRSGIIPRKQEAAQISEAEGPDADPETSPEARIVELALSGKIAAGTRRVVDAQRAKGIPITYRRGNQIVKEYNDGRIEVLGSIEAPKPYKLPPGVTLIKSS